MKYELEIRNRGITDQDILDDIRKVAGADKKTISMAEYALEGEYGVNTIVKRFGGW